MTTAITTTVTKYYCDCSGLPQLQKPPCQRILPLHLWLLPLQSSLLLKKCSQRFLCEMINGTAVFQGKCATGHMGIIAAKLTSWKWVNNDLMAVRECYILIFPLDDFPLLHSLCWKAYFPSSLTSHTENSFAAESIRQREATAEGEDIKSDQVSQSGGVNRFHDCILSYVDIELIWHDAENARL